METDNLITEVKKMHAYIALVDARDDLEEIYKKLGELALDQLGDELKSISEMLQSLSFKILKEVKAA